MQFLLYLFFIFQSIQVMGQSSGVIKGKVVDDKNGNPLENVTVRIKETDKRTLTNNNGTFEFTPQPPGKYTLLISYVGYAPLEKTVTIKDAAINVEIKLSSVTKDLSEVTVTGMTEEQAAAKKVRSNVMPVTILTAKQIENRASNLNELLARQTGVQVRRTGGLGSEARISVRGLEGKRVQVFIDGNAAEVEQMEKQVQFSDPFPVY